MSHDMEGLLSEMVRAVRAAGRITRAVQSSLAPDEHLRKKDRSPVTVADLAAQALVARMLSDSFPDVPLVGEESSKVLVGDERGPLRDAVVDRLRPEWADVTAGLAMEAIDLGNHEGGPDGLAFTLDTVDGTSGFLRDAHYAIALALIEDGRVVAGALGCPRMADGHGGQGVVFTAQRGGGCHLRCMACDDAVPVPVGVSDVSDPTCIRMCESVERKHTDQGGSASLVAQLGIAVDPVRMDSQAKYGTVARGDAEVYIRIPTVEGRRELIWDHAAGAIVVEEAGGRVTDLDGRPLDFGRGTRLEGNRGILCSNGGVHDAVLAAVRSLDV